MVRSISPDTFFPTYLPSERIKNICTYHRITKAPGPTVPLSRRFRHEFLINKASSWHREPSGVMWWRDVPLSKTIRASAFFPRNSPLPPSGDAYIALRAATAIWNISCFPIYAIHTVYRRLLTYLPGTGA